MRFPARTLLFPVILPLLAVTASSQAEEMLFSKSSRALERLWSGVLGCHDVGVAEAFVPHERHNSDDAIVVDHVSSSISDSNSERRDYAECARQQLRNTTSRMLVETIEDAVQQGGSTLLDNRFRLDSSVSWLWGEGARGELDAIVPLWDEEYRLGTGSALFMQPGFILWKGLENANRIDANLGLVFRSHVNVDTVMGGSFFYDHDFKRGHRRVAFGADVQSGNVHAAINYYHPISEWLAGRDVYEEQALRGADFRLGFVLDRVRLDGSLGIWRFESESEQERDNWHASFEADAGFRVLPGVFLEGGYERHNTGSSLGSRWNAGLAFRFSLPGLEGATGQNGSMSAPDLWQMVKREKRILYEERLGVVPSVATLVVSSGTIEEGEDPLVMIFNFDKPLEREVTVVFAPTENATADPSDYALSGSTTVAPPETSTRGAQETGEGERIAFSGAQTDGAHGRLEMTLPQYTSSIVLTLAIVDDDISEPDELIDLDAIATGANAHYVRFDGLVRVTILRNDDFTVGFASASSVVDENVGTARLLLRLGRQAHSDGIPISVSASGASGGTTFNSPTTLTIPARTPEGQVAQSVASIEVPITDDADGELDQDIVFTISEGTNFPESPWRIDPNGATHTLRISANDNAVGFSNAGDMGSLDENSVASTDIGVRVFQVLPRVVDISLATSGAAAEGGDYNISVKSPSTARYSNGVLTIPPREGTITLTVTAVNDTITEDNETATLTLGDPSGNLPEGWAVDAASTAPSVFANVASFTIPDNDHTVGFEAASSRVAENIVGAHEVQLRIDRPHPTEAITLDVAVGTGGTATENTDYSVPATVTIAPASDRATIPITITNDSHVDVGETIELVISVPQGSSLPVGWSLGRMTHIVTIVDDEAPARGTVGFAENQDDSAVEGETVVLTVESTADANAPLPLTWAISRNSDQVDGANSGIVTIPTGGRRAMFDFVINNDSDPEDPDDVVITLTGPNLPTGWVPDGTRIIHTVNIPSNDRTVRFSPQSGTVREFIGFDQLAFSLNDPAPSTGIPIRVEAPAGVTISAPDSSEATWSASGSVFTILSGRRSAGLRMAFTADNDFNNDRHTISFSEGSGFPSSEGWSLVNRGYVLNVDDRRPDTVEFAADGSTAAENFENIDSAAIAINISRALPSGSSASVLLTLEEGTGVTSGDYSISGAGYTESTGVLGIPDGGETSISIVLVPGNDTLVEEDETVTLVLSENADSFPDGWEIGSRTRHVVTIEDNETTTIGFTGTVSGPAGESGTVQGPEVMASVTPNIAIPFGWSITPANDVENPIVSGAFTADGNSTASFPEAIRIREDDIAEVAEVVTITLTDGDTSDIWTVDTDNDELTFTIPADDNTITFGDPSSGMIDEESGGATTITVRINQPIPDGETAIVTITPSGSATLGRDYMLSPTGPNDGELMGSEWTLPTRRTSASLTVTAIQDDDVEIPDENIELAFAGGTLLSGWSAIPATHTIAITDIDVHAIEFASDASDAAENIGSVDAATVTINISRALPSGANASVLLAFTGSMGVTSGDYSISGTGYNDSTGVLDLPEGETSVSIELVPGNDTLVEEDETVTITLSENAGSFPDEWEIGGRTRHVVTIEDNEITTIGFTGTVSDPADESGTVQGPEVMASATPNIAIPFGWRIEPAADVENDTGTGAFTAGGRSTIPFPEAIRIEADAIAEDAEEITIILTDSDLSDVWTLDTSNDRRTFTIPADDNTVTFGTPSAASIDEEMRGSTAIVATINRPIPSGGTATIAITPGGGATLGSDYMLSTTGSNNGNIVGREWTLPTGEASATLTVTAIEDPDVEVPNEDIELAFAEGTMPRGWSATATTRSIIIADTDAHTVEFAAEVSSAAENVGSVDAATITINISRALPSGADASVLLAVVDGIGVTSGDYSISGIGYNDSTGVLDLPEGEGSVSIELIPGDDTLVEEDETVTLTLSENSGSFPAGWEVRGRTTHVVTIRDSETTTIGFSGSIANPVGESGSLQGPRVMASATPDIAIPFGWMIMEADGDAIADVENSTGSGRFVAGGEMSIPFPEGIRISEDADAEIAEVVTVILTDGDVDDIWTLDASNDRRTFTIPASDNTVAFGDPSIAMINEEADGSNRSATITATINLPIPSGETATIAITPGGGATLGSDYMLSTTGANNGDIEGREWTLPTGEASATLTVTAVEDDDVEVPNEDIELTFAEGTLPSGWSTTATARSITITDTDAHTVEFAADGSSATENVGSVDAATITINISRALPSGAGASVLLAFTDGEGVTSEDYSISGTGYNDSTGVLDLPEGEGSVSIELVPGDDTLVEEEETVTITLSAA